MYDLKWIRENPQAFDHALQRRGLNPLSDRILPLDQKHRQTLTQVQELQNERNTLAKQIGLAKGKKENTEDLSKRAIELKDILPDLEKQAEQLGEEIFNLLAALPNRLDESVPEGENESDNKILRQWGNPWKFSFQPKCHFEIGEALGMMDFETAAKISGARFVILSDDLARLERALGNFMLDLHTREFGYEMMSPSLLVRDEALFGTGQLPKFTENLFKTTDGRWLIPTSEVSLTNLVREKIIEEKDLPLRFTAYTPCFRSEAGAAGKDTRGMIRQHQFYKVELVSITHPDKSQEEHERMTMVAEEVLQQLKLPYQVALLCSGDTSTGARKTYDLEVWLPGEKAYREISSCSNTGDYQARRMNARFRPQSDSSDKKASPAFVHTLNGSGVAVGRALIAVLENYQQEDGSVKIPDILQPYMNGQQVISRK